LPKSTDFRRVFIAGGTGYIGSALLPILLERGHRVRVLVRPGSKAQLPAECEVVSGNPLDANSYRQLIRPADTFIHLVGVAHPSRAKAAEFRAVDLISVREAVSACGELGVQHFVYLSVAHPAPLGIMKNYIAVRAQCEKMIEERRLNCSILRPWYVVGPGRRWPYLLMPFYKVCEWLPFARGAALRLGLVTLDELILALIDAVESPAQGGRVIEVPEIREAGLNLTREATRKASLSLR
jgi:uncharacterized protein YbjT (DUF2867 family)